jgi:hypothetical protein
LIACRAAVSARGISAAARYRIAADAVADGAGHVPANCKVATRAVAVLGCATRIDILKLRAKG